MGDPRIRRYESTDFQAIALNILEADFWSHVEMRNGSLNDILAGRGPCWEWKGTQTRSNKARRRGFRYGLFRPFHDFKVLAHRFSYVLAYGPFDPALNILHQCDNPPCVRPDHLLVGTQRENMIDAYRRGRRISLAGTRHKSTVPGMCSNGHVLENELTWTERNGDYVYVRCGRCVRDNQNRRRAERKAKRHV